MAYTFKHGDRPLEGFAIQRAVGRGGFGEVYYAVSDGGREVALKYLRENPQVELRGVAHCINLKSPHLVSIFDVKKNDDGDYFVIMEYVSGPSLRDLLIAEPNGLGPQKAAYFVREIAKGLGYLHDRGIVHRDLKPGNIFYDEGYVKIGDYGLSKFISVSRHSAQTASVGTVHYMAPEVGSGSYTRGIDIYALGVMLYEMLLGKVPFEGSSMGEVLMKHLTEQPEVDNLPQPFGKIIHKALQKDPKDRYQSVYELIDDLMEVDDVRTSLAGFNPVSLSGATRRLPVGEDSPAPSPNPSPRQIPPPRPRGQVFNLDAGSLPPEMAKRVQRTSSKVDKRMRKLDSKHGIKHSPAPQVEPPRFTRHHVSSDVPTTKREFLQRAMLALLMAVCLGFGVAMVNDMGEAGYASSIMMIAGMSGGLAIGVRALARASRSRIQPRWVEKIFLTVPVLILAGLGSVPLTDEVRNDDLILAVVGAMAGLALLGNWRKRIDSGARGKLSIGYAITAGLFALIATAILSDGHEDLMLFAAGVAASVSLVFEALSWLFPLKDWIAGVTPGLTGAEDDWRRNSPASSKDGVEWEPQNQRSIETVATPKRHADPEDSGHSHAMPGDERFLEPASTFAAPQPPLRWPATRVIAALLGFACLVGLVGATVYMATGEPSGTVSTTNVNGVFVHEFPRRSLHENEFVPAAMLAAGCLGLMMFAFRKVRRHRTHGIYGDTIRPIMRTVFLVGITYGAAILLKGHGPHRIVPGRTVLIVSTVMFIVLLFVRGRSWHERHREDSDASPQRDGDRQDTFNATNPQPTEQV